MQLQNFSPHSKGLSSAWYDGSEARDRSEGVSVPDAGCDPAAGCVACLWGVRAPSDGVLVPEAVAE